MKIPERMQQIMHGLLEAGTPFVLVEIRGCKPDTMNYTSKQNGQKASFSFYDMPSETIGESGKQVRITLDLPKNSKLETDGRVLNEAGVPIPNPFKKGDKALVTVRSIETKLGATRIQAIQCEPWLEK